MNIHEYQAKSIFKEYGIPVPCGVACDSIQEAVQAAQRVGDGLIWVVKAQIHAGGRGKAGGVKIVKSLEALEEAAKAILGKNLVTHQTTPEGKEVRKLYLEEGLKIQKEYYLAIVFDRMLEMPVIMASQEGGMEIEEVARERPEALLKIPIDPLIGFRPFHGRKLGFALGLEKNQLASFAELCALLFKLYLEKDAEIVEINPLVYTEEGCFVALDAKVVFDNNALYRHPAIAAMRDLSEEEPSETEASQYNLSYIKLQGNVGCMVNGAGLAMATMDIIKHEGGEPANFLDVGGGAKPETVAKGFEIILRDPNVKAIFVNIFGGIVRCDRVAQGILEATKIIDVSVPIVVRLDGTNAAEAAKILQEAKIPHLFAVRALDEGAKCAVALAKRD